MPYADKARQREFQRNWMRDRRAEYFNGKSCSTKNCTGGELQLHHRDPETKVSHKVWSWRQDRREAELAKCIVLCKGCHLRAHGKQPYQEIRT